jgi:predicted RNA-binding Zn-ribbon protein involved in translation (DUF1610 family)
VNEYNWKIEHDCPQCGASVTFDEADRLFLCPYCRTKLYLVTGDHFRYYIPPPAPTSREIIYIPYWRMKGLSFAAQGNGVSHRFVDTNRLAINFRGIPSSLGLRPQVFTLKFVSPETEGGFIDPQMPVQDVLKNAFMFVPQVSEQKFISSCTPTPSIFFTIFIGETASLIYSPMYLENNILYDSLLKRPVCTLKTGDMERMLTSSRPQNQQIAFISTLCPQCGWDMQGEKDALVLICKNCDSAWRCQEKGFEKVAFAVMAGAGEISQYLPFWRMKVRIEGIKLESYADLIRIGNLPKAMSGAFEEMPLYFWSPAFKVNPALFLRWARQMTISQPEGKKGDSVPGMPLYPVTLPINEAKESIIITIADIVTDKRRMYPLLPQMRITLDECLLVYHPFIENHNELIHASMRFSFDKKSLAYGINL